MSFLSSIEISIQVISQIDDVISILTDDIHAYIDLSNYEIREYDEQIMVF